MRLRLFPVGPPVFSFLKNRNFLQNKVQRHNIVDSPWNANVSIFSYSMLHRMSWRLPSFEGSKIYAHSLGLI